jgi:hypothetical protein
VKYLDDGAGSANNWWERDPNIDYSNHFMYVYASGYPYYYNYASGTYGVCLGFCSGSAAA